MTKKKAFTLIEAVLVLAIIALLVGLLFPAIRATRAKNLRNKTALTVESNMDNTFPRLPLKATMIKDKGNEWYEFTLDGKQYLYKWRDDICVLIGENDGN